MTSNPMINLAFERDMAEDTHCGMGCGMCVARGKSILRLADEVERLRGFAAYVMADVWEHNEPDYGSIQDKAEELGLIELRPIDSEDSIDGESEHYFISWAKP